MIVSNSGQQQPWKCNNREGSEAIERLRFLASLPLAGTGQMEGGEKTQPFYCFQSRLGTTEDQTSLMCTCRGIALARRLLHPVSLDWVNLIKNPLNLYNRAILGIFHSVVPSFSLPPVPAVYIDSME